MKFNTGILVAVFLRSTGDTWASKTSKMAKKSKKSKGSSKACPTDAQEAAAMGAKAWADLWLEIVQATPDCEVDQVSKIWSKYLTDDAVVVIDPAAVGVDGSFPEFPSQFDIPLGTGREETANFMAGGTSNNCAYKNFLSFTSHSAEINPDDCRNFTVKMNEFVTYPMNGCEFNIPTGRAYGFRLSDKKGRKKGPYAKLNYIRFSCPWDLKDNLVDCPAAPRYDPMYIEPDFVRPDECFPLEGRQ